MSQQLRSTLVVLALFTTPGLAACGSSSSNEEVDYISDPAGGGGSGEGSGCVVGTWDHDGDASTACVVWRGCGADRFVEREGTATTDRVCAGCAEAAPEGSACLNGGEAVDLGDQRSTCDCPQGTWGDHCEWTTRLVTMGDQHDCALGSDCRVRCWGDNSYGQSQPPTDQFQSVAAGANHTCALRLDGTVQCWGDNSADQLLAPTASMKALAAGGNNSCALPQTGAPVCWGEDSTRVFSGARLASLSVGATGACGMDAAGLATCWGSVEHGEGSIGAGPYASISIGEQQTCAVSLSGELKCWGLSGITDEGALDGVFTAVTTGSDHSCALRDDGSVSCWAVNTFDYGFPSPEGKFRQVASGGRRSCGIREDGGLACWAFVGGGFWIPDVPRSDVASLHVFNDGPGSAVCGLTTHGGASCFGMAPSGRVACGWNSESVETCSEYATATGQAVYLFPAKPEFGQASVVAEDGTFPPLTGSDFVTSDIRDGSHGCAIDTAGAVECWGDNTWAQADSPQGTFTAVSVTHGTSCALQSDKGIHCWGDSSYGITSAPSGQFATISLGGFHGCALAEDGTAHCWGANHLGQATAPAGKFVSVLAAEFHSCGLRADHRYECWGQMVMPRQ